MKTQDGVGVYIYAYIYSYTYIKTASVLPLDMHVDGHMKAM